MREAIREAIRGASEALERALRGHQRSLLEQFEKRDDDGDRVEGEG